VFLQISNLQVQAHVIRRCFEAMWIKADSKKRSKMTQHRQSARTRKSTKRSVREASKTEPAKGHHGLIMGPTTACGGGRTAVRPGWHSRASPLSPICSFFLCLFVFLHVLFSVFTVLPLKEHVSRHLRGDSSTPFHSPFSFFFSF